MKKQEKRFIGIGIMFVIVALLVFYALNLIYEEMVLQDSLLVLQTQQFEMEKNQVNVVFFGDSHVQSAINPRYISDSFNYASGGENYWQTYYKLKTCLEGNQKIHTVVLQLDLNTLSSSNIKQIVNGWYWKDYVDYTRYSQETNSSYFEHIIRANFPLLGSGPTLISLGLFRLRNKDSQDIRLILGHQQIKKNYSDRNNLQIDAKKRSDLHFRGSVPIDRKLLKGLLAIISLANEHDLNIIVIRYPASNNYIKESSAYVDQKKHLDMLTQVSENIYIIDHLNLYNGNMTAFADPDHLNAAMAIEFSVMLNKTFYDMGIYD